MCKVMEDMLIETVRETTLRIAQRMLKLGKLSYEEMADALGLTIDEVKALDESRSV